MNANAQQINETFRTWNQQWSDAALKAVGAHEQFVANLVGTMSKPAAIDTLPGPARQAVEHSAAFAARQTLQGEKFVAGLMREGIENTREPFKSQPEMVWPADADKARANADRFMKETANVMNREMAFVNERLSEFADFGRTMMECGFDAVKTCGCANPVETAENPEARKPRVATKA